MVVVVSRGGNLGGRSVGGDDPLLPPLGRLLLPLDPEEPLPATLYGSSSLEPDPKGLVEDIIDMPICEAGINDNGPGAD